MDLLDAALELSAVANAPDDTYEDAMGAAQQVLTAAENASDEALDGALRILLAAVRADDDERAGIGAIVCGALVERGAQASLATEHLVERMVVIVKTCAQYVDRCRAYFEEHILSEDAVCEICGPEDDEPAIMMPQVRTAVSAEFPKGEAAWIALDLFCRPTVSVLVRDPQPRRQLAADVDLVNVIGALSTHQPGAYFVWALLSLLDEERLVVIEPEIGGWFVRINGVADNFQLHLLLAEQLIRGGYVDGEPLDEDVAEVVRGDGPPMLDDYVIGYWNLYNWTALAADGTLPDGYFDQGAQHLIQNEGVPADIRALGGQRVVLLGPTPVIRQWQPARLFEPLKASLEVERAMTPDELADWLQRIQNRGEVAAQA